MTTKRRGMAVLAVLSTGALVLSACGSGDGDEPGANRDDEPSQRTDGTVPGSTITVAVAQDYTAYNDDSETGNGTWNTYVHNGIKLNFWSYGPRGEVVREEEFGTYEKVSDDPLTIEYTIDAETQWSDGEPIDCDDILLEWAANSGAMVGPDGKGIFKPASTNGYSLIEKPDCQPGDKKVTIVYSQPYIDWEQVIEGGNIPAHVAAEQGGLTPEELVTAIQDDDIEALTAVAQFWNTGWGFNPGELPPREQIPSSGPYLLEAWDGGQSITLRANPDFYGTPPPTETVVLRILAADQQVDALENREVDIINSANPTPDTIEQLEQLADRVTMETGASMTWSHIDFQQGEGRAFEPLEVRQAFAKCIPRETIVQNLILPANPDAVVQDMREFYPVDDDYEEAREEAFPEDMYGEQDLEGARQLLQQAGVSLPVDVTFMHSDDPVRNDLAALVKSSCDQVGFNVTDFTPPDWGERLNGDPGSYDAAMFGWAGSGSVAAGQSLYITGGGQNPYGYSNERVDELWDQAVTSLDQGEARQSLVEMETELWDDVFNVPLYTNANVLAYASGIENVVLNATQTGVTFNMDEWIPAES